MKIFKFLIINLFVLVCFIIIIEISLHIIPNHTNKALNEKYNSGMKRLRVIDSLNKEKILSIPLVQNNLFNESMLPLGSVSKINTVYCNENGYYSTYLSDRYGFNNYDKDHDNDQIDIVLIGDSFVNGACVNQHETVSSRIRQENYKVLSFGLSGNGPLLEYATYREYVEDLKPKFLIWFYFEGNDLRNLKTELNSQILLNYLEDREFSQNLSERQNEIDSLLFKNLNSDIIKFKKQKNYNIVLLEKVKNLYSLYLEKTDNKNFYYQKAENKTLKLFFSILEKVNYEISQNQGKLLFVYLPQYERYKGIQFDTKEIMLDEVKKKGIKTLDFDSVIMKYKSYKSFFPIEGNSHYTPKGYKILASEILKSINLKLPSS